LPKTGPVPLTFTETVGEAEVSVIRRLVASTDFFTAAEVDIAVELVSERISRGRASGYEFILARNDGRTLGFVCYGPTPATEGSYDLYWIVVDADAQRGGIGKQLLKKTEEVIHERGGKRLYADTSSQDKYLPTRAFYRRQGFRKVAELPDFYRIGDNKLIYEKAL
jgi:ribosomal protein S18 acetylase RimI-like enzyme